MRGAVDTPCQTENDRQPVPAKSSATQAGQLRPGRRRLPLSENGDARSAQKFSVAHDVDQRRRKTGLGKPGRIAGLYRERRPGPWRAAASNSASPFSTGHIFIS